MTVTDFVLMAALVISTTLGTRTTSTVSSRDTSSKRPPGLFLLQPDGGL